MDTGTSFYTHPVDAPAPGRHERRGRITYRPDWDSTHPWRFYINGECRAVRARTEYEARLIMRVRYGLTIL